MVLIFKVESVGILLTLVFLSVYAPICRASTHHTMGEIMSTKQIVRKAANTADTSHHRSSRSLLRKKMEQSNIRPSNYGKIHGPFLSETEVKLALNKAGFPAKAIPSMLQIAHCESSFSATAENVNRDGSVDFGLFQINERNWGRCNVTKTELSDPYNNAKCAYQIWQRQGYGAWGCYVRT